MYKEVFTQSALAHRHVYRQKLLRKEVFTQRAFTHGSFHTEKFLHREVFTQRSFYRQKLFHTEAFTQRDLYTEKLSHAEALTHKSFHTEKSLHREAFTRRSFCTQKLLHREVFTQRRFYTKWKGEIGSNSLGKTLGRSFREQAFSTCSKEKIAVPWFHVTWSKKQKENSAPPPPAPHECADKCAMSVPERLELYGEARPKPPTLRRRAPKNIKNLSPCWGRTFWTESWSLISVSKSIIPPPNEGT